MEIQSNYLISIQMEMSLDLILLVKVLVLGCPKANSISFYFISDLLDL